MAKRKTHFDDSIIIYRSEEDKCWIAHSLKTDQIGAGERIVDALAEALKAVRLIHEEAKRDDSLAVYRDAPAEIAQKAKHAKRLPLEIFDVAHKIAHGDWPEEWIPPEPKSAKMQAFKTDIEESTLV